MSIKVSVISSVYNGSEHFEKAIPSILRQTYSDFEYLIVDDGSTDQTYEKLKAVAAKDSRIRIFRQKRVGRARALNYAVEKANGEIVIQQDFDDISCDDRIENQLQAFSVSSSIGVVGGAYVIDDAILGERYLRQPPTTHEAIVEAFARYIPIAHTTAAFRKDAWASAGGYPIVDDIEDLLLWIQIAKRDWRFACVQANLGTHFIYPQSYWASNFVGSVRQDSLAKAQCVAIKELDLRKRNYVYPFARRFYRFLPSSGKAAARKIFGSTEKKYGD